MRKTLLLAALAGSIAAGPLAAQPATRFAEMASRLEGQGFEIQEMERKNDRFEVKATNAEGQRIRLDVDASTGEILRQETRTRGGQSRDGQR